jgi:hypothetical protein
MTEMRPVTKRSLHMMKPATYDAVIKQRREALLPGLLTWTDGVTAPLFEATLSHEGSQGFMKMNCPICLRTNSHGCDFPFTPNVHHRGGHCGCYPSGYFLRVDP